MLEDHEAVLAHRLAEHGIDVNAIVQARQTVPNTARQAGVPDLSLPRRKVFQPGSNRSVR
jgi:hypothetical protein